MILIKIWEQFFNRKVISNKKKVIDECIVRSKKHYNGLIHAWILRENRLHKKQIKEDAEKKLPLFIRDLKFGKSPASVKKLNREFECCNKEWQIKEYA